MKWSDVVGHSDEIARLRALRHVPHALIFGGPPGVGKLVVAHALARELLLGTDTRKESESSVDPNGDKLLEHGNFPDLHLLTAEEGKREIAVEGVRELTEKLHLRTYYNRGVVALIDNAHKMSIAAANALLMTLEEPPPGAYLILVTDAPHRLLPTIVSRCQLVTFGELSQDEVRQILERLFPTEHTPALLNLCQGSLAALELEPFVDRKTARLRDPESALTHVTTLSEELHQLARALREVKNPLSLASQFAAMDTPHYWSVLRSYLRGKVRESEGGETNARWAELLLKTLQAQASVSERNLSVQNFLPELLFRLAELQGVKQP
jgi:replication-associated recombination protein RarA